MLGYPSKLSLEAITAKDIVQLCRTYRSVSVQRFLFQMEVTAEVLSVRSCHCEE